MLDRVACSRAAELTPLFANTPYHPLALIGRGGMGEVFEVQHRVIGKKFAVKLLLPQLASIPGLTDRLRLEAQSVARLSHPNVVEVVDFWVRPDGLPAVVMELLRGRTLQKELVRRPHLGISEAIGIACDTLSALEAAHAMGMVHRDIKPANIFLHEQCGPVVKVLDFGLVRILPDAPPGAPAPLELGTASNMIVGSPRYASPEARGGQRADPRGDLYAVGLVLYEMLAGQGPFDVTAPQPNPPSHWRPGLSDDLDRAVMRGIAKEPQERYQRAVDFISALRSVRLT